MASGDEDQTKLAVDFAWRTHEVIQQWTRNVDQKSSVMLAVITAVGAILAKETLTRDGGLAHAEGLSLWGVYLTAAALLLAALCALAAIMPNLRARNVRMEAARGLIFFGHLHYRDSTDEVAHAYSELTPTEIFEQLARQNRQTSTIAWDKHRRLQVATVLLIVGVLAFAATRLS